jgi:hypothetical protein
LNFFGVYYIKSLWHEESSITYLYYYYALVSVNRKIFAITPVFATVLVVICTCHGVHAVDVQSNVQILAFCGIDIRSGSPLDYNPVKPGEITDERDIFISNPGDAVANVFVRGTDWQGGGSTVMNVGATHFSATQGQSYDQMNTLSGNDAAVMQLNPGNPPPIEGTFWRLKADLTDPSFRGSASQTLTLSAQC